MLIESDTILPARFCLADSGPFEVPKLINKTNYSIKYYTHYDENVGLVTNSQRQAKKTLDIQNS